LKKAINNNKFKDYDNGNALGQVAAMPYSNSIKPVAICIVRPSQASIDILKQYVELKTVNTLQSIYTWAKPQIIVVNGVQGKQYGSVSSPVFSPDSQHVAYWA
jgi:hypothetical protein